MIVVRSTKLPGASSAALSQCTRFFVDELVVWYHGRCLYDVWLSFLWFSMFTWSYIAPDRREGKTTVFYFRNADIGNGLVRSSSWTSYPRVTSMWRLLGSQHAATDLPFVALSTCEEFINILIGFEDIHCSVRGLASLLNSHCLCCIFGVMLLSQNKL